MEKKEKENYYECNKCYYIFCNQCLYTVRIYFKDNKLFILIIIYNLFEYMWMIGII